MKTVKIRTFATGIAACILLMTACKKEGPAGPAGANGTNGLIAVNTDGFIRGNVSGTRQDGTPFNEAFDYQNYWSTPSATLDSNNIASYDFNIGRSVDIFGTNSASITINTTSKTASSGTISLNSFSFTKSLGTNQLFAFSLTSNASSTITGLVYNTTSGLYTGNFSFTLTGLQNSTGNTATVNGSFEATVTQMHYMMLHNGGAAL
ncbi:MAG: hypothetical protein ABIQ40_05990 [Bacteroidia bacterium]